MSKCKICGRPLKDTTSVLLGIGPICRGGSGRTMSKRTRSQWAKINRGRRWTTKAPMSFSSSSGPQIYNYNPDGERWELENSSFSLSDKDMRSWLYKSKLARFDVDLSLAEIQERAEQLEAETAADLPPSCPDHNVAMKVSKYGGWYCTRKIAGTDNYCSYKAGDNKLPYKSSGKRTRFNKAGYYNRKYGRM